MTYPINPLTAAQAASYYKGQEENLKSASEEKEKQQILFRSLAAHKYHQAKQSKAQESNGSLLA